MNNQQQINNKNKEKEQIVDIVLSIPILAYLVKHHAIWHIMSYVICHKMSFNIIYFLLIVLICAPFHALHAADAILFNY